MSLISTMEAILPPGFRFHPRDDELVLDYLCHKLSGKGDGHGSGAHGGVVLVDVDLNKCEPWDLPDMACVGGKEWYFFTLRDRKYATGQRTNRATQSGYWKATGKDRTINKYGVVVGMRKTLVFYQGRAPRGKKTEWVLHEFRMEEQPCYHHHCWSSLKEDWVLCRVFYKSRTTTPLPASGEAGTTVPSLPLDGYIAFDGDATSTAGGHYKQLSSFSGIPAIAEKKTVRTVLSYMSSNQLESSSSYMQENVMSQAWNAF